jgi:hypothetical protein
MRGGGRGREKKDMKDNNNPELVSCFQTLIFQVGVMLLFVLVREN